MNPGTSAMIEGQRAVDDIRAHLSTSGRPSFDGLIDTLDRLIGNGAAVAGDVVIALDGIDLTRWTFAFS